ncbi:MAG: AMP-binding protein [Gammaproteobacteria bacterium]|nr:AMP-binding protein [Gammaproteobacteria bacterium]
MSAADPSPGIYQLLVRGGAAYADAVALTAPDAADLSYGCLLEHLEATGRALNERGVGRGDAVALVLPNGPEAASAFLAVAAFAVSAPLNAAYRAPEFDFYLGDLDARALIIAADLDSPAREVASARGIPVLDLSPRRADGAGLFDLWGEAGDPRGDGPAESADIALVLHTSGTTGRPKRVPLTHANLCISAYNVAGMLRLTSHDCCLNVMPLFHIHGLVAALLASMAVGANVVCTPGFDAPRFFEWMNACRPTWYTAVPTMHQAILSRAAEHRDVIARASLRFIRSSSASLPPLTMTALESVFGTPVIEAYGMTEAAHQMTSNPLPPQSRKPGSVGLPAGPEVAVMSPSGQLLGAGQTGEVVIRGPSVTAGYAGDPDASAKAFTDGWFRTGDEGYRDAEGFLFLTGRLKEMINRGGETIAPREIDEALLAHPAVAEALAFAVPDERLGEDIAAAVVLAAGGYASERELRAWVAGRLADHKVPARIVFLDEIPKGTTGKLQRIGMHLRLGGSTEESGPPEVEKPFTPPRTLAEKVLAETWGEVLRRDGISIHDDFLHLGGDSLLATRIVARLRSRLRVKLTLLDFFDAPTIVAQALILEARLLDADP